MEKTSTRQTLVIRTEKSAVFEEAHFLFRDKYAGTRESEIVTEANRILALCEMKGKERKKEKRRRSSLFYFASGLLCGLFCVGFSAGLFWLLK